MSRATSETAFEEYVEYVLLESSGWRRGSKGDWDVKRAIFAPETIAFVKATQPALWDQMQGLHGSELETKLIDALCKELDVKGTLNVLRHGFKFYGKTFRLAYFRPAHGLNPDARKLYDSNRLTVTRQVPCHPNEKGDKGTRPLDLVFAVNGVPVATCELKNPRVAAWSQ